MLPRHLAIIMDGNGRWARTKGRPRTYGHLRGARTARDIIKECRRLQIPALTLYTFSTENWLRPKEEVSFLMYLLERNIRREQRMLMKNNICFKVIGDIQALPESVKRSVQDTIEVTKNNDGMILTFALNYGGRQEITKSFQQIAKKVQEGLIKPEDISEEMVSQHLQTSTLPDPDIVIRTSGEFRLSNFLLWQSAYSEFFITPILWPDFQVSDLQSILNDFSKRERRYGGINVVSSQKTTALQALHS